MPVTVTVETGSVVAGANSYLGVADFRLYADQRGLSHSDKTDDEIGSALIRATSWLNSTYGTRFPGVQTGEAAQSLLWPRKAGSIWGGVFYAGYPATIADSAGWPIAANVIPQALKDATAEAAWRELQEAGSLAPDLERGGAIRSLRAGSVAIEYASTAPAGTTFSVIEGLLSRLLVSVSGYSARAVRS